MKLLSFDSLSRLVRRKSISLDEVRCNYFSSSPGNGFDGGGGGVEAGWGQAGKDGENEVGIVAVPQVPAIC